MVPIDLGLWHDVFFCSSFLAQWVLKGTLAPCQALWKLPTIKGPSIDPSSTAFIILTPTNPEGPDT